MPQPPPHSASFYKNLDKRLRLRLHSYQLSRNSQSEWHVLAIFAIGAAKAPMLDTARRMMEVRILKQWVSELSVWQNLNMGYESD